MATRPTAGIIHANARTSDDAKLFRATGGNVEVVSEKVVAVELVGDFHGIAKKTRAGGLIGKIHNRFQSAEENSGSVPCPFSYDVHAKIHSINHVDVGKARWAKHRGVAFGETARRMGSKIVLAEVSFCFDDAANALAVDEELAEEFARNLRGVAVIKSAREWLHGRDYFLPVPA